jgi:predicted hotdog family 3-hydroxylacyl-ACP dehydratase
VIDRAGIAALIPHAGTMCLLDQVLHWDAESIRCTASSHRNLDNPLAADGWLGAACGVEYAAQTMAIHGGLAGLTGERPKAGYLASIRALTIHRRRLDDLEDDLIIDAKQLATAGTQVSYGFSVSCGGTTVLEGRATVLLEVGKA